MSSVNEYKSGAYNLFISFKSFIVRFHFDNIFLDDYKQRLLIIWWPHVTKTIASLVAFMGHETLPTRDLIHLRPI